MGTIFDCICLSLTVQVFQQQHSLTNGTDRGTDSIVSLGGSSLLPRRLQDPLPLRPDQLFLQVLKAKAISYHF